MKVGGGGARAAGVAAKVQFNHSTFEIH
jgi:hypothetical protein